MVTTHRVAAYLRLAGLSEQNIGKIADDYYACCNREHKQSIC
jgi:hypothetical protein